MNLLGRILYTLTQDDRANVATRRQASRGIEAKNVPGQVTCLAIIVAMLVGYIG